MADSAPLQEDEVKRFVERWYLELLDSHAAAEALLECLADDELEMRFPEETARGHEGFKRWYDRIVNTFFDEVHTIKELSVSTDGDRAEVKVLVNWQAHTWAPPAPKSQWLGFDAGQTWIVKRSPTTQKPVVVTYIVDTFVPMEGSTTL
jgi:ketosteroid isomerase-like protein